jgi:hypothetical protein
MLKYCVEKWDRNKDALREALSNDTSLNSCDYTYLVKMVVTHILNEGETLYGHRFNVDRIVTIDDGSYQGCQLFVIPMDCYQPAPSEYLIASQYYGSCSGCDTLLGIQDYRDGGVPTEEQLSDYMTLCKDIVCSMVHPFKGYRDELWKECTVDG